MNTCLDTYVKIKVISGKGKRIGVSMTGVRVRMSNPEYNQSFIYPMSSLDLVEATVLVSVLWKRKRRKAIAIGWFAMGKNNSGEDPNKHWNAMRSNPDTDCDYWHLLLT